MSRLIALFIYSAGAILVFTSAAKVISAFGNAHVLHTGGPIMQMSYRHMFLFVGAIELAIGLICFLSKSTQVNCGLLALLSTNFLIYRCGLVWIGFDKPCDCMGNLTESLHIPYSVADNAMKVILAYLLLGSYTGLFWFSRQRHKSASFAHKPAEIASGKAS